MTAEQRQMLRALRDVQVKYEGLVADANERADRYAGTVALRDQQIARLSGRLSRLTEKLGQRAQTNADLRVTVKQLTVRTDELETRLAVERALVTRLGEQVARLAAVQRSSSRARVTLQGARDQRLSARFWRFVQVDEQTGCWTWTGAMTRHGYARIGVNGKTEDAHRVAFRVTERDVPRRLRRDCGNRACVNPDHWISTGAGRTTPEGWSAPGTTGGEA